jgi:hypothetical protein
MKDLFTCTTDASMNVEFCFVVLSCFFRVVFFVKSTKKQNYHNKIGQKPMVIWRAMIDRFPGLGVNHVKSHLQKYRNKLAIAVLLQQGKQQQVQDIPK